MNVKRRKIAERAGRMVRMVVRVWEVGRIRNAQVDGEGRAWRLALGGSRFPKGMTERKARQ